MAALNVHLIVELQVVFRPALFIGVNMEGSNIDVMMAFCRAISGFIFSLDSMKDRGQFPEFRGW